MSLRKSVILALGVIIVLAVAGGLIAYNFRSAMFDRKAAETVPAEGETGIEAPAASEDANTVESSSDNVPAAESSGEIEEEEPEEQTIFEVVEEAPSFPGGMSALMQFLSKNIKYPTIAQENGVQGRVICQFVVNRDGSIVDVKVIRGVDAYLDKEAVRVIQSMPKWTPGKQRGKAVRVRYTLPVMFRLQ